MIMHVSPLHYISSKEILIIQLISQEYNSQEIAEQLGITKKTVEYYRRNIFNKLDVRNAAGLVRVGFELGILVGKGNH